MTFTGKNLILIRDALARAISDVRTDTGLSMANDPSRPEWEQEIKQYEKLLLKVEAKCETS